MRLFIAALIPEEIRKQLTNYINSLKYDIDGVKWEKSEKLHITLKFLGDVDKSKVDDITNLLGNLASGFSPFKVQISEFGGIPHLRSPRILYVGISNNKLLSRFHNELEQNLSGFGFEKENRKFTPHVTIGRVKKKIHIKETPPITQKSFQITQIGLMKSELRPNGSVYTPIKLFHLDK